MQAGAQLSRVTISAVFEQSLDCVKFVDADGRLVWMNRNGLSALEIDGFTEVDGADWSSFWPVDQADTVRKSYQRRPPRPSRFTAFCPTAKGTPKWWEVSVTPVDDGGGAHCGFVAISRDVTAREAAERTRDLLVAEIKHRQKNTLALASSLVALHGRGHAEARGFVTEMTNRLSALGRAHEVIARDDMAETPLDELLVALVEPLASPHCVPRIDAAAGLRLSQSSVDVVGVVLGELAVNAGKHGAFLHGGTIEIVARAEGRGIAIEWHERSERSVAATARHGGQGLDLMRRIAETNGARFDVAWHADGPSVTLALAPEPPACG